MIVEAPCAFCGKDLALERVGFRDECPHCDEPLHCCLQCSNYAPGKSNDCAEPQAELVRDKDRNNLCEWYKFGPRGSARESGLSRDDAEAMLKDLFKK